VVYLILENSKTYGEPTALHSLIECRAMG